MTGIKPTSFNWASDDDVKGFYEDLMSGGCAMYTTGADGVTHHVPAFKWRVESTMDNKQDTLDPNALHQRLAKLWKAYIGADGGKAVIHLNGYTAHKIYQSSEAHADGSLGYVDGRMGWRNIPIVTRDEVPSSLEPLSFYENKGEALMSVPVEHLFCMYIEVKKPNGRRVYFDDPDTAKEFL